MKTDLPDFVAKAILDLTLDATSAAWLLVSKDGILKDLGGDLDAFGLQPMTRGALAKENAPYLKAILPLGDDVLSFSAVELDFGVHADIHLLPDDGADWVILLNRSNSTRWKAMAKQKATELNILRQQLVQQKKSLPQADVNGACAELVSYCQTLNILPMVPMDDGSFRILMPARSCFRLIYPEVFESQEGLQPDLKFPFVENFLVEAREIWKQDEAKIKSGPWIETDPSGNEIALEAMAVSLNEHKILLIEMLGDNYEEGHNFLQKGREGILIQQLQEKSSQAKSEFLSYMSHELRTPMNVIMGYAQLLETEEGLTVDQQDSIQKILGASNHLLELINELLDLARIESGHIDLNIEPLACADILRECIELVETMANWRSIKLHYDEARAREFSVLGDFVRLKQVLLNLLSNAIKYNKEGGRVDIRVETAEGSRVRILVTDTGMGLSSEQQAALFQPYNRLGIEDGKVEGTGIGLMISKQLIEMMDGTIGIKSKPGEGSTFWIDLLIAA